MATAFRGALVESARLLHQVVDDGALMARLDQAAATIVECFQAGGKVLSCGNGGSMADAMHFAEEWTGRFRKDRRPYPALALADPTHLSCTANDFGFEHVFARGVEAFGRPGDVLLVLSTSGDSDNIVLAASAASTLGVTVIGFLGRGGGQVAEHCDLPLVFPGETSDRIQELHMLCLHALIETVEDALNV
ncbi:MAG: SIS domain-containing protein [Armatimonadetes bacterium]|nr:SIS domain-containing protein [Armatimonadota bacterium]